MCINVYVSSHVNSLLYRSQSLPVCVVQSLPRMIVTARSIAIVVTVGCVGTPFRVLRVFLHPRNAKAKFFFDFFCKCLIAITKNLFLTNTDFAFAFSSCEWALSVNQAVIQRNIKPKNHIFNHHSIMWIAQSLRDGKNHQCRFRVHCLQCKQGFTPCLVPKAAMQHDVWSIWSRNIDWP